MLISRFWVCMILIYTYYRGEPMEVKIKQNKKGTNNSVNPLYVEMGQRLRISRIKLNYTQEQMAEILEMSTAYYGKIERGVYGLSLAKLVMVNEKLDIDINYLLTGMKRGGFSLDNIMSICPKEKRYDMEQLIKYAVNLVREKDN